MHRHIQLQHLQTGSEVCHLPCTQHFQYRHRPHIPWQKQRRTEYRQPKHNRTRQTTCAAPVAEQQAPAAAVNLLDQLHRLLQAVPGGRAVNNLHKADEAWQRLCDSEQPRSVPQVISEVRQRLPQQPGVAEYDVVVLGGTLGIFQATALALKGRRVAVVERAALRGREQEWNIGRKEMQAFIDLGVLTAEQVDEVIVSEFNPVRVGIGGTTIVTRDVLNCGVSPRRLLDIVKQRFLQAGGTLLENVEFQQATVHPDGVALQLAQNRVPGAQAAGGAGGEGAEHSVTNTAHTSSEQVTLHTRLLVDAMGSFSPIVRQARKGVKPDSVVLMVGSCAEGLPTPKQADLLYSFTPIDKQRQLQFFWEIFPAQDGVTTYMFAYTDPTPGRISLGDMFQEYLRYLPAYAGCDNLDNVSFKRTFHGFVPNWVDSPLKPCTARLLHVGDSSGNRSALSFAGFGAIARHLRRLTKAIDDALTNDTLDKASLRKLQPWAPAISITAAMQQSMGTRAGQQFDKFEANIINEYIGSSFATMAQMGEEVYRPFMQDVMQAGTLGKIVSKQLVNAPGKLVKMNQFMQSPQAGAMLAGAFAGLVAYDAMYKLGRALDPVVSRQLKTNPKALWSWKRQLEAWEFGSANDYEG